jgi:hypothetical protein
MANLNGSAVFKTFLRKLETTDPKHPDTWNPNYQDLINNDLFLKAFADEVVTARDGRQSLAARLLSIEQTHEALSSEFIDEMVGAIKFALEQAGIANQEASTLKAAAAKVSSLPSLAAWNYEQQAEVLRGQGQSGFFLTRQYNRGGDDAFDRPWTETYNPTNIHNHPNYTGMPGMGEFSAIINGYYFRSRHNDYRLRSPAPTSSAFLATQEVEAPAVPASVTSAGSVDNQITAMRSLFRRYEQGEFPEGFGWTLSYVEIWFEVFKEAVTDTFDSFRHQQYVTTVDAALREVLKFNYGGYKNPSENVSFEAPVVRIIDASGNPVLARLRYRIAAVDVSSLGDLRQHLQIVDDWAQTAYSGKQSGRFRIPDATSKPGMLDSIMGLVPGLDGAGAVLEEKYGSVVIGNYSDSSPLNAAYYNRFSAGQTDASNRNSFRRGYNDPTLFVAMNTRQEVAPMTVGSETFRFSYAIPLELILRTPLENWNPYNIAQVTTITGNGLESNPYNGWRPDARNFRTPAEFYGSLLTLTLTDQADSGTGAAYVTTPSGVKQVRASGIYLALPSIPGTVSAIRLRHPVYPVYHEGSHAHAQAEALQNELEVARGIARMAIDQAGQANHSLRALREQAQQQGEITIQNRGIVSGCVVSKTATATRNLSLTAGVCFARGRMYPVVGAENAVSVPSTLGATGNTTVYACLQRDAGGAWRLIVTPVGGQVPADAIRLYSLTIPPDSTDANDPNLDSVTLTDLRRIEPRYPLYLDNPATVSPALNALRAADYAIAFDVISAVGATCSAEQILVQSRATNGFTIYLASASDDVRLRWKISKLNN